MKVQRNVLRLLSVVALGAGSVLGLGPPRFEIVRPHLGAPAILRPGDSLTIEVVTSLPFWRPELEVALDTFSGSESLAIEQIHRSAGGTRASLVVSLPADSAVGGVDLAVSAPAISRTRPRAVQIVEQYSERVRLVQIADLPVVGDHGVADAAMEAIVDEINLIAPDAVLITGDLIYGEGAAAYESLLTMLARLEPPVIATAGNHEYKTWSYFLRHFVRPRHVVDLGPLYVVSLNSGHRIDQLTHSQLRWLSRIMAERPGRTPVLQIHHPLFGEDRVARYGPRVAQEIGAHHGPIVLSGHLHHDAVFEGAERAAEGGRESPGPKFFATTAAGSENLRPGPPGSPPTYSGYRLVRLNSGKVETSTYDYDGDGARDPASSYPFGRLQVEYPESGTAVITNGLNEVLDRAVVRTTIPGIVLDLEPDRGRLVGIRVEGGSTVYLTELDLPANSVTVVHLMGSESA